MRRYYWVLLLLSCYREAVPQETPYTSVFISDVTVIDATDHPPAAHQSVLIEGNRIKSVRGVSTMRAPANAVVIDGRGKYLIPGLWNMHVHLGSYDDAHKALEAYLARGITGVRDMGSPLEDILRVKSESSAPDSGLPLVKTSGPIVQGPLPFVMPLFVSVSTATQAQAMVDSFAERGVDFIKIQDAIPRSLYLAVAQAAKKNGLPLVGHVPPTVLADEASDLGQRSIEHLGGRFWGVLLAASTKTKKLHLAEQQMYDEILDALRQHKQPPTPNMRAEFTKQIVTSYDKRRARQLYRIFKRNGTWNCPTLVALPRLWDDTEEHYTSEDKLWAAKLIAKDLAQIRLLRDAKAGVLAGTDLPADAPNGSLAEEMAALANAGLTPLESLQTATRNPAIFFGLSSKYGTVEPGKIANLVLLDDNPMSDIRNVAHIQTVLLNGRVVHKPNH